MVSKFGKAAMFSNGRFTIDISLLMTPRVFKSQKEKGVRLEREREKEKRGKREKLIYFTLHLKKKNHTTHLATKPLFSINLFSPAEF